MFARASLGIDYHDILRDRLEKLIQFIKAQAENLEEAENWRFAPQVDTGELVDVAVAQRAGLGFIGRNGLLITEEFGSFVYLGEIVTNISFETDEAVPLWLWGLYALCYCLSHKSALRGWANERTALPLPIRHKQKA